MSGKRILVAAATDRIPVGSLKQGNDRTEQLLQEERTSIAASDKPAGLVGRPRKDPSTKARGFSITLWPEEAKALDELLSRVNEGLPAAVGRSDITRLALLGLMHKSTQELIEGLASLRKKT